MHLTCGPQDPGQVSKALPDSCPWGSRTQYPPLRWAKGLGPVHLSPTGASTPGAQEPSTNLQSGPQDPGLASGTHWILHPRGSENQHPPHRQAPGLRPGTPSPTWSPTLGAHKPSTHLAGRSQDPGQAIQAPSDPTPLRAHESTNQSVFNNTKNLI